MTTIKEALEECDGCFEAALCEGWLEALAEGDIERIRDIWDRRLSYARNLFSAALADIEGAGKEGIDCEYETSNDRGRMLRIQKLIAELTTIRDRFGNTCVYIRDVSWGAVALNNRDADEKAIAAANLLAGKESGK